MNRSRMTNPSLHATPTRPISIRTEPAGSTPAEQTGIQHVPKPLQFIRSKLKRLELRRILRLVSRARTTVQEGARSATCLPELLVVDPHYCACPARRRKAMVGEITPDERTRKKSKTPWIELQVGRADQRQHRQAG